MQVSTIKEFCTANGYTQIVPTVRKNTNGYPFVTFITTSNKAENVYMSKSLALTLGAETKLTPSNTKGVMIGNAINKAGEVRIKLISNSERMDISALFE